MSARTVLAVLGAALAVLFIHVLIMVAAVVITVTLAALLLGIAILAAECGWSIQPVRRRFAW